jgi:outer membrane protein assembly factor BamC
MTVAGLAGCGALGSIVDPDGVDYKSAGKAPTLAVPPDLTQLQRENRYAIPSNQGTATASGYNLQQNVQPSAAVIAQKTTNEMRIERAGDQRWLVVDKDPEELWPLLKDFWQDLGFLLSVEMPQAGIMETDWAENRAKIPQDFIRSALGKAIDSLYSTAERDKFRTRLERTADGKTEIYISHRGMQEMLLAEGDRGTVWQPRPADPELEAEFLSRLMTRFGADAAQAKASVANAPVQGPRAKLIKSANGGSYLEVDEGFDRAWRRVGLALDRVGFTVEDRNRAEGLYFVRYIDPEQGQASAEKGFFSRLFTFGSKDEKANSALRYRVAVKGSGPGSQVMVLNEQGQQENSPTASKILTLLNEQLK